MNDFFSNLVARSFSDAPVIQPRLPSLFETAANEFSEETQSSTSATAAAEKIAMTPPLGIHSKPSPVSGSVGNTIENTSEASAEEHPLRSDSPEEKRAPLIAQALSSEKSTPARKLQVETKRIIVSADSFRDGEKDEDTKKRASESFSQRDSIQPQARRGRFAVDQRSSTSPPIIRVTIGRVEVRAIHPPTHTPKLAKTTSPKVSLEDYLHKREGGLR
jgi:hypothetical protein